MEENLKQLEVFNLHLLMEFHGGLDIMRSGTRSEYTQHQLLIPSATYLTCISESHR